SRPVSGPRPDEAPRSAAIPAAAPEAHDVGAVGLGRRCFAAHAFAIGLNGAVPLFRLYEQEFALATGNETLVFGAYSLCVVPGLILFGALSDVYGRRIVMVPSFVGAIVASLILANASDLTVLVVGRIVQGLTAGAFWGTLGAFARDLTP